MRTLILTTLAALAFTATAEARSDMTHERGGWHDLTCPDRSFCLYDIPHGDSDALVIRSGFDGWHNLNSFWRNEAEAQKNTRNRVSLLAGSTDGNGKRYCAEPNSQDSNLGDNAIGLNNAVSFKLITREGRCARFGY